MSTERAIKQAQEAFDQRKNVLINQLANPDFLANKGLGNEVGVYILCYDPALELDLRAFVNQLEHKSQTGELPCNIIQCNLYDHILSICEKRRVLSALDRMEQKRGTRSLIDQLRKTVSPAVIAESLTYEPHNPGDVLLITGVGEAYPLVRVHALLDNIQHLFEDVPVIVAYPGHYDGQSLRLFAGTNQKGLEDGNYYRAFNLV